MLCNFSDLREHRFRHHFNCFSPICPCNREEESTAHYILRCPRFNNTRFTLLAKVINITNWFGIIYLSDDDLLHILLHGSSTFNKTINFNVLSETTSYIKSTKRFDVIEAYTWFWFFASREESHPYPAALPLLTVNSFLCFLFSHFFFFVILQWFVKLYT